MTNKTGGDVEYWGQTAYDPQTGTINGGLQVKSNEWANWGLSLDYIIEHYDGFADGSKQIMSFYFYDGGFDKNLDLYMTGMTFVK